MWKSTQTEAQTAHNTKDQIPASHQCLQVTHTKQTDNFTIGGAAKTDSQSCVLGHPVWQ